MEAGRNWFERFRSICRSHPLYVIGALLLAALVPFLGKAIHIDDSLFVWSAEHILKDAVKFYGFDVNWTGTSIPMSVENCNPPLQSYLLAGVVALFGTSEIAMHAVMVCVALATLAGT